MRWLDVVKRDPVPWLLDPVNPSVRLLTLRHIFNKSEDDLRPAYARLRNWPTLEELLHHWDSVNFWGRSETPYYGGAAGNFGTLYLLTQMGVPRLPEVASACENLLDKGRHINGYFAPEFGAAAPWLCYTGIALQIMWHFGYWEDLRVQSARRALVEAVLDRQALLDCPAAGGGCRWGVVKALGALVRLPTEAHNAEDARAINKLSERLLNLPYDFEKRDAHWLRPIHPRYYQSDLIELCHVLAQTPYRTHYRFQELIQRMIVLQTDEGRWLKMQSTPVLPLERIQHPSRWLTFEAVHTLVLTFQENPYAGRGSTNI